LKIENDHLVLAVFISFAWRCTSQITVAWKTKAAVASTLEQSVPSRSAGKETLPDRPERAESQRIVGEEGKVEETKQRNSLLKFWEKEKV